MLQHHIDQLEVLEEMLRRRVRDLEEQSYLELQKKAAAMAENKSLKRKIKHLQNEGTIPRVLLPVKEETQSKRKSRDPMTQPPPPPPSSVTVLSRRKTKKTKASLPAGTEIHKGEMCNIYKCPIQGCTKKLFFPSAQKPPLDVTSGMVSDKVPWFSYQSFRSLLYDMRLHFNTAHGYIPKNQWPVGFAENQGRRQALPPTQAQMLFCMDATVPPPGIENKNIDDEEDSSIYDIV